MILRETCVKNKLKELGYTVNSDAQDIIKACNSWYKGEVLEDFHRRKNINNVEYELSVMRMGKRCCSDDANLCEVVEINAGDTGQNDMVNLVLKNNQFDTQYRRQLEQVSAVGTAAAYIRLEDASLMSDGTVKSGRITINYVNADGYIPLTVVNNIVTEAAFSGSSLSGGKKHTALVVFTQRNGRYQGETFGFDEYGTELPGEHSVLTLGEVCPFAVMRNAEVNNIDDMDGYGLPKLYNAIPILKGIDLAYNVLFTDLGKAEKILLVNEILCEIDPKDGKPKLTPEQKKLFVMTGERLPEQKEVIYEYNPEIRVQEITDVFKLLLSLLSMMFGYGTKKYDFEGGQITTATEFVLSRQDAMQELNRQRKESAQYIQGICRAIMWFSNTFHGTAYNVEQEVMVDFDDSLITDKESELERMRSDALSFGIPAITEWYLAEAYNLTPEEARKLVAAEQYIRDDGADEPEED